MVLLADPARIKSRHIVLYSPWFSLSSYKRPDPNLPDSRCKIYLGFYSILIYVGWGGEGRLGAAV